jgi:hypothetical protein
MLEGVAMLEVGIKHSMRENSILQSASTQRPIRCQRAVLPNRIEYHHIKAKQIRSEPRQCAEGKAIDAQARTQSMHQRWKLESRRRRMRIQRRHFDLVAILCIDGTKLLQSLGWSAGSWIDRGDYVQYSHRTFLLA